jgi:glycosyltransferase involved in cell wall biosynthesis
VRIAIDARPALDPRRTGVGRYARQMVRNLPAAVPNDEVVAWYLDPKAAFSGGRRFDDPGPANLVERASPFPARAFRGISSRLGIPKLEWLVRFDVLLATNFLPPPTAGRVVPVVHDLAYEVLPETAPHHDHRWRRRFDAWLRRAPAVIVPSRSTKADLLARHHLEEGRVRVVPHGIEPFERPSDESVASARSRFGIGGPYALFVGAIEPRKNLSALVGAFASMREDDVWLVIAGGRAEWIPYAADLLAAEVAALPEAVRRRIVLTGHVRERDRRALLAGASALAYPSRYEGFGFPVLEAFAAGVPVLTSTASSLPEVAGDAALLVDPNDPDAIAGGLRRLLEDRPLRARLVEAGAERGRSFTWEASAAATAEVLSAAGRR